MANQYSAFEEDLKKEVEALELDNKRLQLLAYDQAAEIEKLRNGNGRFLALIARCSVYRESSGGVRCRACDALGINGHTVSHEEDCEYIALIKGSVV